MACAYTPTPCRRCGGDKGPRAYKYARPRYCAPCQTLVSREYWRKNFAWWCGACDSPHYCPTCSSNKKVRQREAAARAVLNRQASQSGYFRPFNAERWWQRRSHTLVKAAVKRGLLPNLKSGEYACADCGSVAHEYDHRDYGRPFDVVPVCRSCNKQRGTALWPDAARFQFARTAPTPDAGEAAAWYG